MWNINDFPPPIDIETRSVLKKLTSARSQLAELKGLVTSLPNPSILINTLALQEAKDSSEVENIIATHDELFKSTPQEQAFTPASKEVHNYARALFSGFKLVRDNQFLTLNHIKSIHTVLSDSEIGFRTHSGTELRNNKTGETVFIPPQDPQHITDLMSRLESFINDNENDYDPLVRMALMHHQFESIHPFPDGNGRTGRILNILYLVLTGLIDIPILYLSRYITTTKYDYYRLLQGVRDSGNWEEWIIYILDGITATAKHTIELVNAFKNLMQDYKNRLRDETKIYSQDILNVIFKHPYTKISNIMQSQNIGRQTATKYLNIMVTCGLLEKHKIGRQSYYINIQLLNLFTEMPPLETQ
ncbi:MAG: addiction module protein [Robiginitomaculum sp.]|nr:MAG: addiction module protein [Robiginitomaculum sp.]